MKNHKSQVIINDLIRCQEDECWTSMVVKCQRMLVSDMHRTMVSEEYQKLIDVKFSYFNILLTKNGDKIIIKVFINY